jgi:hypothetical protein
VRDVSVATTAETSSGPQQIFTFQANAEGPAWEVTIDAPTKERGGSGRNGNTAHDLPYPTAKNAKEIVIEILQGADKGKPVEFGNVLESLDAGYLVNNVPFAPSSPGRTPV